MPEPPVLHWGGRAARPALSAIGRRCAPVCRSRFGGGFSGLVRPSCPHPRRYAAREALRQGGGDDGDLAGTVRRVGAKARAPIRPHRPAPFRRLSHWPLPCEDPYLGPWSRTTSPLSRSSPFPPVVGWLLDDHRRCDLHLKDVAELPQFLRGSRVLEKNTIDLEGIQFTGPVAIDSLPDASNKRSQLCAVIVRNDRTRSPSLRLARHGTRLLTIGPTKVIFPAGIRSIAWIPD